MGSVGVYVCVYIWLLEGKTFLLVDFNWFLILFLILGYDIL